MGRERVKRTEAEQSQPHGVDGALNHVPPFYEQLHPSITSHRQTPLQRSDIEFWTNVADARFLLLKQAGQLRTSAQGSTSDRQILQPDGSGSMTFRFRVEMLREEIR
jgi:hypothetical protein